MFTPLTLASVFLCGIIFSSRSANAVDKLESDFFDNTEIKLQLEHSFFKGDDNEEFTPRGVVEVKNLRGPKFTTDQPELSLQDLDILRDIGSEHGYYFLKISTKGSTVQSFRTFIPAKSLLDSGLSDVLTIHLTPNSELYAVSYSISRNDYFSSPHVLGNNRPPPTHFNTTVLVHYGELGPVPDTAPYLEKMEQERMSKERGDDQRDNRSFLGKYWMYIVPVLILVLLSGASNPDGDGGR